MELYEKLLEKIEDGNMIFDNVKYAKCLAHIADEHYMEDRKKASESNNSFEREYGWMMKH